MSIQKFNIVGKKSNKQNFEKSVMDSYQTFKATKQLNL